MRALRANRLPALRVVRRATQHHPGSLGRDVAQSFLDLSSLVASDQAQKGAFEELAFEIGRDVYADLNGWHLFMKDMSAFPGGPKMAKVLAEQIGSMMLVSGYDERDVEDFLTKVPVKLGSGKTSVSLDAVLPSACVQDLLKICSEFERKR